jgi:hypothetical protein
MFGVYKAGLKRYTPIGFGWEYAHRRPLRQVTPTKARNFFPKAIVPGCKKQHSKESAFFEDLLIATAAIAATHSVVQQRNAGRSPIPVAPNNTDPPSDLGRFKV